PRVEPRPVAPPVEPASAEPPTPFALGAGAKKKVVVKKKTR
ncbi:polymer-forming cytoskeletal protein, partial [Myxococcus sp. AM011]|nr:polymer-forming cytoskeletal protein [Myxococcus sp. AM011]